MALISCPECGNQVASSAASCPKCGVSIAAAQESKAAGATLTTIQETSKKLKLHSLGSMLAVVIGVIWVIVAVNSPDGSETPGGALFFIIGGLLWFFVTRFRIWWHHK